MIKWHQHVFNKSNGKEEEKGQKGMVKVGSSRPRDHCYLCCSTMGFREKLPVCLSQSSKSPAHDRHYVTRCGIKKDMAFFSLGCYLVGLFSKLTRWQTHADTGNVPLKHLRLKCFNPFPPEYRCKLMLYLSIMPRTRGHHSMSLILCSSQLSGF